MKNKILIHVILLISVFSIVTNSVIYANDNERMNKVSLKFAISPVHGEPYRYNGDIVMLRYKPQINMVAQYELVKDLKAGVFIGYSNLGQLLSYEIEMSDNRVIRSSEEAVPSNAIFYGLSFNYSVLPLLLNKKRTKLDCYPLLNIGFITRSWNELDGRNIKIRPSLEYHAGVGIGCRITSKTAIFGEYTIGRFYNDGRSKLNIGIKINL